MPTRHREGAALIAAPPEEVFAFVDDHSLFSSHMSQSSWMMGGGRTSIELDDANGQAAGSHIRLSAQFSGLGYPSTKSSRAEVRRPTRCGRPSALRGYWWLAPTQ